MILSLHIIRIYCTASECTVAQILLFLFCGFLVSLLRIQMNILFDYQNLLRAYSVNNSIGLILFRFVYIMTNSTP